MENLSPMMKQYMQIKEQHKNHILFFRLGDFYEMFFDDAVIASKELELTLTGKVCGLKERAPMCGVPFHSASTYIAKLIKKGYKVAICEQTEDPSKAKGLVKREVIRVITPGTVIEDNMLSEGENNYISSICVLNNNFGLSFADTSTGEIYTSVCHYKNNKSLENALGMFMPKEIICNTALSQNQQYVRLIKDKINSDIQVLSDEDYGYDNAVNIVQKHFKDTLSNLGLEGMNEAVCSLGALLMYLYNTQQKGLETLNKITIFSDKKYMELDLTARRNLELIETLRDKSKKGSLLWVIDKTKTAMGKRLIRSFLERPLVDVTRINKRLNAVEELTKDSYKLDNIVDALSNVFDLERLLSRVSYGSVTPRDLKALEYTLNAIPNIKTLIKENKSTYISELYSSLDELKDIKELINKSISDEPPINFKDGKVIKKGFNSELDDLKDTAQNTKEYLASIELAEREKTGIKNLKIGFNKVFGYYIEVTKSNIADVPNSYIRKQTLTNCERYITEELKVLEEKILTAKERIESLEIKLYNEVIERISTEIKRIQKTANAIALLDVYSSLAKVSLLNSFVKPTVDMSGVIDIKDGRHCVVENMLKNDMFVANDVYLDKNKNQIALITGPNMAGKSTYMRQVAIICILAQIGCFVPAKSARIGVVDGIYTRVGATDDLSSGQSTFMVEMNEVANILKNATSNSLLILDEIGRGTSTYDGMSIARAVLEFISNKKKLGAKTLFATHYHELTDMERQFDCIHNFNIAVKKRGDDVIFLRRILKGGTDDSFGIYVSKLAGIPNSVIKRAEEILIDLENKDNKKVIIEKPQENDLQMAFEVSSSTEVENRLKEINIDDITPKQALAILYELKDLI